MSKSMTEIKCPKCGTIHKINTLDVLDSPTYVCAGCNTKITLDSNKANRQLEAAKKQISDSILNAFKK